MTRGRSGEKTYTGYNGARESALRAMDKLAKSPAGTAGRHAAPSQEALRRYIADGLCPFCGSGEYKNLGCHTNRSHGVSADELREMAGMLKGDRICSPELSETFRAIGRERGMPAGARSAPRKPRVMSAAGREVNRAKLAAIRSPETQAKASRAAGDKTLAEFAGKHAEILRLFHEGLLVAEIASRVGVATKTVKDAVKRAGVDSDLRVRYRDLRSDDERKAAGRRIQAASLAARRAEALSLVERFSAMGGSYTDVHTLATERGVSAKSMADRLRKAGADVPDGRPAANQSRYSEEDLTRMVARYEGGASQGQVAKEFGCNQAYVSLLLRKRGVKTRAFARTSSR